MNSPELRAGKTMSVYEMLTSGRALHLYYVGEGRMRVIVRRDGLPGSEVHFGISDNLEHVLHQAKQRLDELE